MPDRDPCRVLDLGKRGFEETLALQRRFVAERQRDLAPDTLVFVEHPPTYTLGRGGDAKHLLADEDELKRLGARVVATDRGGDVTFHGPGQIVGYPILDLRRWHQDVHRYLRAIEETLLIALAELGVTARREPGLTGVWHERGKLAAIGVRVSRWVTSHGFALNVSTDLRYFNHIVPCGIVGRDVSSMEDVLRQPVAADGVKTAIVFAFATVFERRIDSWTGMEPPAAPAPGGFQASTR